EKTIDASDVSETLFGYSDDETSAMKSHLETLMLIKATHGENAKLSTDYNESLSVLSNFLGIPKSVIEKDFQYYYDQLDLMEQLGMKRDEESGKMIVDTENLTESQKKMYGQLIHNARDHALHVDLLTGRYYRLNDGVEVAFNKQGELIEVIRDANGEIVKEPTAGQV